MTCEAVKTHNPIPVSGGVSAPSSAGAACASEFKPVRCSGLKFSAVFPVPGLLADNYFKMHLAPWGLNLALYY
jgi:hypothetical protein